MMKAKYILFREKKNPKIEHVFEECRIVNCIFNSNDYSSELFNEQR